MPANLKLNEANVCRYKGYFYHLISANDTLYKKTDDGTNAFSYPLDTHLANTIASLQTDGIYFYTLENVVAGNGQLIFKRWKIKDFVLKLDRTYTATGSSAQRYNCNAFAIEHFNRVFILDPFLILVPGSQGNNYVLMNAVNRLSPGDILNLGPSTFPGDEGQSEQVTVLSIGPGNKVILTTNLLHSYNASDSIIYSTRCWFFNKFRLSDLDSINGSGELFSFDLNPLITTFTARRDGNEFKSVLASTFLSDTDYFPSARDFLVYMNQTNLLFIETDPAISGSYLNTIESASQNNQDTGSNVIPVYEVAYENKTLFRLQQAATFKNGGTSTTENWAPQYNYQLATLERLPASISLTATPAIIAADHVSSASILAIVKDQFDNALGGRTVTFTDDDTGTNHGVVNPASVITSSGGQTSTTYSGGVVARTVTITASVS